VIGRGPSALPALRRHRLQVWPSEPPGGTPRAFSSARGCPGGGGRSNSQFANCRARSSSKVSPTLRQEESSGYQAEALACPDRRRDSRRSRCERRDVNTFTVWVPETRIRVVIRSRTALGDGCQRRPRDRVAESAAASIRADPRAGMTSEADAAQDPFLSGCCYAARSYSWMSPPSRSRRPNRASANGSARVAGSSAGGGFASGGRWARERCGLCSL
jgi:hypothetical protein